MGGAINQMISKLQPLLQPFLDPVNPLAMKIAGGSIFIGAIIGVPALLIFAPIFNFFIIPKIEKRVGEKLKFRSDYSWGGWSGYGAKAMEVAEYITRKYMGIKIKMNAKWALVKINYDVQQSPRSEIIISIIATVFFWIMYLAFFISFAFWMLILVIVFLYKQFGIDLIF